MDEIKTVKNMLFDEKENKNILFFDWKNKRKYSGEIVLSIEIVRELSFQLSTDVKACQSQYLAGLSKKLKFWDSI